MLSSMLHLASQSPRRQELLRQIGVAFDVLEVQVPEIRLPGEPPGDYVNRVAREKAGAGLLKVMSVPAALVLGADTEVVLDDEVFGKPEDAQAAAVMLHKLSGRTHRVITAVWLVNAAREAHVIQVSEVTMAAISDALIADYIGTGECFGKAGAYANHAATRRAFDVQFLQHSILDHGHAGLARGDIDEDFLAHRRLHRLSRQSDIGCFLKGSAQGRVGRVKQASRHRHYRG